MDSICDASGTRSVNKSDDFSREIKSEEKYVDEPEVFCKPSFRK